MDRNERFYKIDHLIRERGIVPVRGFFRELEVSLPAFKRDKGKTVKVTLRRDEHIKLQTQVIRFA
jgi:hypothetical protein